MYELLTLGEHPIWKKISSIEENNIRANKPNMKGVYKTAKDIYCEMVAKLLKVEVR